MNPLPGDAGDKGTRGNEARPDIGYIKVPLLRVGDRFHPSCVKKSQRKLFRLFLGPVSYASHEGESQRRPSAIRRSSSPLVEPTAHSVAKRVPSGVAHAGGTLLG